MKKGILGLFLLGCLGIVGCNSDQNSTNVEEPSKIKDIKKELTESELNSILESYSISVIKNETLNYQLNNEQKEKITKRIKEITEIEKLRDKETKKNNELRIKRANWQPMTFIDDFGDPTTEKYICQEYKNASFTNSATRDEILEGVMIITKDIIRFDSYEYGRNGNPKEKFITDGVIKMKNSQGKTLRVSCNRYLSIHKSEYNENYNKILNFFKSSNGNIKIIIQDRYSTIHKFDINSDGFTWNYNNNL